jgi:hypothetical protein
LLTCRIWLSGLLPPSVAEYVSVLGLRLMVPVGPVCLRPVTAGSPSHAPTSSSATTAAILRVGWRWTATADAAQRLVLKDNCGRFIRSDAEKQHRIAKAAAGFGLRSEGS